MISNDNFGQSIILEYCNWSIVISIFSNKVQLVNVKEFNFGILINCFNDVLFTIFIVFIFGQLIVFILLQFVTFFMKCFSNGFEIWQAS